MMCVTPTSARRRSELRPVSDLMSNIVFINAMEMARQHPYWRQKLKDALAALDQQDPQSDPDIEELKRAATMG